MSYLNATYYHPPFCAIVNSHSHQLHALCKVHLSTAELYINSQHPILIFRLLPLSRCCWVCAICCLDDLLTSALRTSIAFYLWSVLVPWYVFPFLFMIWILTTFQFLRKALPTYSIDPQLVEILCVLGDWRIWKTNIEWLVGSSHSPGGVISSWSNSSLPIHYRKHDAISFSLRFSGLHWESYTLAEFKSGDCAVDVGDGLEKKGTTEDTQR